MLVDSSSLTTGATVTGAIRQAAQATGTSFQYLLATAQVESGLDPQAGAATSSARGLFQFIDQTWLATMKQSGAALGYGRYAAAITQTASGQYEVRDPAMRREILKLRNDPTVNAVMAGAFTQSNAAVLSERLGRAPSEGELYIAHFLGAGGAARLISAAASHPDAAAARYFPSAAHANASIFYDRATGAARSLAQVRDLLTARYDVASRSRPAVPASTVAQAEIVTAAAAAAPAAPAVPAAAAAAAAPTAPATVAGSSAIPATHAVRTIPIFPADRPAAAAAVAPAPGAAGAVPARLAEQDKMFHDLFADSGRATPVAQVVSELWGAAKPAPGASAPPAPSGLTHDLFKDGEVRT